MAKSIEISKFSAGKYADERRQNRGKTVDKARQTLYNKERTACPYAGERGVSMAKPMSRRAKRAKLICALALAVLLVPLSVGYAVTARRAAQNPPEPSVPQTTVPETTVPQTTAPQTTVPETTVPETTVPAGLFPRAGADEILTVTPEGDNWALTPVGYRYRLPADYVPELAAAVEGSDEQLDSRVAPAFAEMYAAAKAEGCTLTPYAGYVAQTRQAESYESRVQALTASGMAQETAALEAAKRVPPAGASEHNAGLAMDIGSASADFVNTAEYAWLTAHAWEYGFILRYPENKTDKTGVQAEPWHWRYVGEAAARAMHESGQCLEEYLGLI